MINSMRQVIEEAAKKIRSERVLQASRRYPRILATAIACSLYDTELNCT